MGPEERLRLAVAGATRFWGKVDIGNEDDCWEWRASKKGGGYGRFYVKAKQEMRAHRVAWMLEHEKPIPKGKFICHHCDNPSCVNPDHVYLGDNSTNMKDMWERGRVAEATIAAFHDPSTRERENATPPPPPEPKWDDSEIRQLRIDYAAGVSAKELSENYDMGIRYVYKILKGERRTGAGGPTIDRIYNCRLTADDVREIRERYANGASNKLLAQEFGVSTGHIHKIVNKMRWAHID